MINTTLKDYIKIYRNVYDAKLCSEIIHGIETAKWTVYSFYNLEVTRLSPCHLLSLGKQRGILNTNIDNIPLKKHLDAKIQQLLDHYIYSDMCHMTWIQPCRNHTPYRLNKYEQSSFMGVHCDHISSIFDGEHKGIPILSVLGVLNEDYEGGELFICGERVELKTGDVVIFPSNFLYPHEIKVVKSGTRYSFASWAW